jgi:hypothetical protein
LAPSTPTCYGLAAKTPIGPAFGGRRLAMDLLRQSSREGMPAARRELDGLCATVRSRADAELAIEHLAQEYGIDPAFIYVEPIDGENSAGIEASGGDHACGAPSHRERPDAPLHGAIQVTVPVEEKSSPMVQRALKDVGAASVELS